MTEHEHSSRTYGVNGVARPSSVQPNPDQWSRPPSRPSHRAQRMPMPSIKTIEGPVINETTIQDDDDFLEQREDVIERISTYQAPYEGLEALISPFENYSTSAARATYQDGRLLAVPRDDLAIVKPTAGLIFLAGADTPQVNQNEASAMTDAIPDQKSSSWRVYTAGALLTNFTVRKDMTVNFVDNTATIVNAYRRRKSGEGHFADPSAPSRALSTRRKPDRLVTIHSENVQIVRDLSDQKCDMEAVLIEVDQSSLMALISNYQRLIRRGGPDLPITETLQLLDTMIEDARRLCIRSPVLFRMATRRLIVASRNTRYGVDDGIMFKTLTTSMGIRNILELSASYFNSLPVSDVRASEKQRLQAEIRPRFLQMVVLLLALLNDDDLNQLETFLETTYRIKADRQNLELLILKVLPLSSINSRIFLHALVTAVDGPLVARSNYEDDQRHIWNLFMGHLLKLGYVVPGGVDEVCSPDHSWVITWPEDGLKDTTIFRNLQYNGKARTINEIPRVDLNPELAAGAELTVILANDARYVIASADLENIVRMSPGNYSVTEASPGGRSFDLNIDDTWVNQPLFRAIGDINKSLGLIKSISPHRSNAVVLFSSVFRTARSRYDDSTLAEVRPCGRLTYHCGRLNGAYLAITYKVDGRAIGRRELVRLLQTDINRIDAMVKAIHLNLSTAFDGRRTSGHIFETVNKLQEELASVTRYVNEARKRKEIMLSHESSLVSEPVSKVLYQVGARDTQISLWREYRIWHQANENVLYVDCERHVVKDVDWHSEQTFVITFHNAPQMRFFATPLHKVSDTEMEEQLKIGDQVLLCGQYLCIVESSGESYVPSGLAPGDENARRDYAVRQPSYSRPAGYSNAGDVPVKLRVPQSLRPRGNQAQQQYISSNRSSTISEMGTDVEFETLRAQAHTRRDAFDQQQALQQQQQPQTEQHRTVSDPLPLRPRQYLQPRKPCAAEAPVPPRQSSAEYMSNGINGSHHQQSFHQRQQAQSQQQQHQHPLSQEPPLQQSQQHQTFQQPFYQNQHPSRPLEMVVNWLRITGVDTSGPVAPRGANRRGGVVNVRSYIR